MQVNKFTHLQVYSNYSLLYGTHFIEDLVQAAKKMGCTHLALTDINNLYGVHEFIAECKKAELIPIIGAEVRTENERVVVLVKDRTGFSNLCRIITEVKRDREFSLANKLINYCNGNIILSSSVPLLQKNFQQIKDLYIMLTPCSRKIIPLARQLDLPLVAVCEAGMLEVGDYQIHKLLRAIDGQTIISAIKDSECISKTGFLYNYSDVEKYFSDCPDAISNSSEIVKKCVYRKIFAGFIFPEIRNIPGGKSAALLLREKTFIGAEKRYGELSDSVIERIEYELQIIEEKGFCDYFLVVADIVSISSRSCGRGSAAASMVAYCLEITNVDPIKYNFYFERFLNPERSDPPDIDVDFAWDERDAIIEYAMQKYGRDYSAMVCTYIHFRSRSAIRDTARAYGVPDSEISAFEKGFLGHSNKDENIDETWQKILDAAGRIKGFPKHLSVHVGGVIITPEPLSGYVPIEKAAKGVNIITWDKDRAEEAGLVKIDFLGNRSLAVIRDAIINCEQNGIIIDKYKWDPANDKKTCSLIARGDTIGVFYIESPAMRQLQKKSAVGDFEHIVIHSSIIRPAANRFISEYIDRLKGKPYQPLHPALDYILKDTYGIMCYQEDVSKAAIVLADFSPAQADGLRKILSKKNKGGTLLNYKKMFFENMLAKGTALQVIEEIWKMIESFKGYSFCKPHSASYANVSYQSAYLKAHHPAEFMAAVLSNQGGYYTPLAYINEAKRMGLKVLAPDINQSTFKYQGKGNMIRVGFTALSRIRTPAIKAILKERAARGFFKNIDDLAARVSISEGDYEILVYAGVLDSIAKGKNRAMQLWSACLNLHEKLNSREKQQFLFNEAASELPQIKGLSLIEKYRYEYNFLGFICATHPFVFWKDKFTAYKRIYARQIPQNINKTILIIGWLITRKAVLTNKGQPMEFVSFEDETDIFETVFFSDAYQKFIHLLDENLPFLLSGRVENDRGAININVDYLKKIK